MSRIGKQLKIGLEELFIEQAIDEVNNLPAEDSIDGIINSVEENIENAKTLENNDSDPGLPEPVVEDNPVTAETDTPPTDTTEESNDTPEDTEEEPDLDSPRADKAADGAEEASDKIDEVENAGKALEAIAELLEQTAEMGGLSPQAADLVCTATDAVVAPMGIAIEHISPELFTSYSRRYQYTMESIETIKAASKQIFLKIIEFIKKMLKFMNDAYRFYNSELFHIKNKYDEIKDIHKGSLNTEPKNDKISGILPTVLLTGKETSSSEVADIAEATYNELLTYTNSYSKDLGAAVASIEEFKEKVFNIDLQNEENVLTKFKRDDLVKFGQFFGTHLVSQLKQVSEIKGKTKPSNTILCYESGYLAGRYKVSAFIPNKINLLTDDILSSAVFFKPSTEEMDYPEGMDICGLGDFRQLFSIIDKMFILNRRIGDNIAKAEKEVNKLTDYVTAMSGTINKVIVGSLKAGDVETNQPHANKIVEELVSTIKRFYLDPITGGLVFSSRYTKALVSYVEVSTKQYQ